MSSFLVNVVQITMETIYYPVTTLKNTSPGSIMFVINLIMVFVFSAIIFTSGLVFYFLAGDFSADTGFIIWTALLLVCCSEIIVCFVGLRGSYLVSLDILINYFWGVSVLIVPLCITIYGSYNYLENAQLYAEHQWTHDSFDNARKIFCDPPDTYKTECMVPFKGPDNQFVNTVGGNTTGGFYNATKWCEDNHAGSIRCERLRDDALNSMLETLFLTANFNTVLAGSALVLSFLSLYNCFKILTSRVISQTMNDNINFLLIIPVAGCCLLTVSHWWYSKLKGTFKYFWIVYIYLALACGQALALTFGILAGRSKSRLLLRMYLFFLSIIVAGFLVGGTFSLNIILYLDPDYVAGWKPSDLTIAEVACAKGLVGCSNCYVEYLDFNNPDEIEGRCPEWSAREVALLLSTESRLVAVSCFLFSLYHVGAFIVTYVVQDNLRNYKSESV